MGLSTNSGSRTYLQNNSVRLDLQQHNARLRIKVTGLARLRELRLRLSNDHWAKWVTMNPLKAYTVGNVGQWASLFLGPGARWGSGGGWKESAPGFAWLRIDGAEIEAISRHHGGPPVIVRLGRLAILPAQSQGKLVFVFDNGDQSILPAASYLHRAGIPGNIGVIGKYVDYASHNYLNVFQLRALQNKWGWDVANQTQQDTDAVQQYYRRHDVAGYAGDIVRQAAWLEANGLNSAPNWPRSARVDKPSTRAYSKPILHVRPKRGRWPDTYPYGDTHRIVGQAIHCSGRGSGEAGAAPPQLRCFQRFIRR